MNKKLLSSFSLLLTVIGYAEGRISHAHACNPITFTRTKLPCEKKALSPCGTRTLFLPRSQGTNLARYLAGWKEYLPTCDGKAWGNWYIAAEYAHSRHGAKIAHYFFGSTQLHFSGSQVVDRNPRDLLADYFGLSTTFEGSLAFNPSIENTIIDMSYYLGLDCWHPGLYFRCNLPIVVSRWDLGVHGNEKNNSARTGTAFFPSGYMSKLPAAPAGSIREALSGDVVFGDMDQTLRFGTFPCGKVQKTGVPQLDFVVGYNWCADETQHMGIYLITIAPTGNLPRSEVLFEPIIGNGRLWEVGPGLEGHVDLMRCGVHMLSFSYNGYLAHQFKSVQNRSFDLIGHGPLSRYMLLKELDAQGAYTGSLMNAIDFSTRAVRVGGSAKLDAAMKLTYYYDRFGLDIGYNLYARTKEKIRLEEDFHPSDLTSRRFGIKGTEGAYYRVLNTITGEVERLEKLNAVQQQAGTTQGGPVSNPAPMVIDSGAVAITWDSPTEAPLKRAFSSSPPLVVTADSLDLMSGSVPHQLTHKFFAHLSYTAGDRMWEPQIGIGAELEVDGRDHLLAALNQWGIWIKCAVSF